MSCTKCEAMGERLIAMSDQRDAAVEQMTTLNRQLGQARAELNREKADDDAATAEVREAFELFSRLCGYPRASLDGKRARALAWAISKKGLAYVRDVIRGAGRFAYTWDYDWQEKPHPSQRKGQIKRNKFESIFDHTVAPLEKFHDLAMRGDRLDGCSMPGETPWVVSVVSAERVLKVVSPWDEGPLDGIPEWILECPVCGVWPAVRVRWGKGGSVDVKCVRGCDPAPVLRGFERLRDGGSDQLEIAA